MKNKLLALGLMVLGGLAVALPASSCAPAVEGNKPVLDDPVSYADESEAVVKFDNPLRRVTEKDDEEALPNPEVVKLHYHNDDQKCMSRRFYTWVNGVDGVERKPLEATWTNSDMEITLDLKNDFPEYYGSADLRFIIKVAGTWSGQSEDTFLVYAKHPKAFLKDADGKYTGVFEVWTVPGEGTAVDIYDTEEDSQLPKITTAKFTSWNTIQCTSTIDKNGKAWAPKNYKLYAFDKSYLTSSESAQKANKDFYLFKEGVPSGNTFNITFNYTAKINVQYVIESWFEGFETKTQKIIVSCENLYTLTDLSGQNRFEQFYYYSGKDLGVSLERSGNNISAVTFKLWSPISALATVNLYDVGEPKSEGGSDSCSKYAMSYQKGGVWVARFEGEDVQDVMGKFYTYSVTHSGGEVESIDPYAKACGLNGERGYVYDNKAASANPTGWDSVPQKWDGTAGYDIATPQDLSIYEIHIRDLTMDETWKYDAQKNPKGGKETPGTYKAFAEKGTEYTENFKGNDYIVKTGYSHIEELGVKAIQLLPVFDQDNNEKPDKVKFNWGYNPQNYNCVEGGYSSNPNDPLARIVEYKELIKAYSENANHTRVIMDVVYNHVSTGPNSCFTRVMPKYYFRYNDNWEYEDGSGCSNEVKSEAPMMRKYIVDSLVWWAEEYKIKGFRFDLMGLLDVETIRQARVALNAVDPDIYIYGEGWQSIAGYHGKGVACADTSNVYSYLYPEAAGGFVGAFNDNGRNSTRGGNDHGWGTDNSYPYWGFISQGTGDVGENSVEVSYMMYGYHHTGKHWDEQQGKMVDDWKGKNPNQAVTYISCHDNYTAYDQIRYTLATGYETGTSVVTPEERYEHYAYNMNDRPTGAPKVEDVVNASIAAHATVIMGNGVAFIQGGEEIYRTKMISPVDNYSQGYKATPEYDELMAESAAGENDADCRPFPDVPTYVAKNDPGSDQYDPTYPVIPTATGEVRMVGDEIVSHNSYKLPDSVNSFKWDRKIHIGDTLTYTNKDVWSGLVHARNESQRMQGIEPDTNIFSVWNVGGGSTSLTAWIRTSSTGGFGLVVGGRSSSTPGWAVGAISQDKIVASNGLVTQTTSGFSVKPYGMLLFRI